MGFSTHPSVVFLERGNYESWAKGILTHCRWLNILPYLYDLIPEPATLEGKLAWDIIRNHIVGVILSSVDSDTVWAISGIDCPHSLWTRLWEIYGDPSLSPFPKDPASDCLVPIGWRDNTPFDHATLKELQYLDTLTYSDESEDCLTVPTLQTEIIHVSTSSPFVPDQFDIASSLAPIDSAKQDIIHLSDMATWDSYLAGISSLFVESYIADLEDYFEDFQLLFVDSHIPAVSPPSSVHSEVAVFESSVQFGFDIFCFSSNRGILQHPIMAHILRQIDSSLFTGFLHLRPLDPFLPKGRNIICRFRISFWILPQASICATGVSSLWGGLLVSFFFSYGDHCICTYMIEVVYGGYHVIHLLSLCY